MRGRSLRFWVLFLALSMACNASWAQKKKKDSDKKDAEKAQKEDTTPVIPPGAVSDNDQIDQAIGEILAGWQIGETALMQKHYAPEAVFVSGVYEPPVIGWTNYLQVYQGQRQRMTNISMSRFNTLIRVKGGNAVASYQWNFTATVDGNPMWARGHSTLVWEKRDGKWMVLHNHTSLVDQGAPQVAKPAAAPKQP